MRGIGEILGAQDMCSPTGDMATAIGDMGIPRDDPRAGILGSEGLRTAAIRLHHPTYRTTQRCLAKIKTPNTDG